MGDLTTSLLLEVLLNCCWVATFYLHLLHASPSAGRATCPSREKPKWSYIILDLACHVVTTVMPALATTQHGMLPPPMTCDHPRYATLSIFRYGILLHNGPSLASHNIEMKLAAAWV